MDFSTSYLADLDHSSNLKKKAQQLNPTELVELFAYAPSEQYRALWAVQYFAAARISETLALRWDDIDFSDGWVTFRKETTKTQQARRVKLPPQALEVLLRWKACQHHRTAQPFTMSRQAASKALKRAGIAAGFPKVSTHTFRRSFVRNNLEAGLPLTKVREITGHKTTTSFLEYF